MDQWQISRLVWHIANALRGAGYEAPARVLADASQKILSDPEFDEPMVDEDAADECRRLDIQEGRADL